MILTRYGAAGEWAVPVCWQRALTRPVTLAPPAVIRRGATRLTENAPSWAIQLASGGALGLLLASSLAPLLPATGITTATLVTLLGSLGLNVFSSYLGAALAQVWQRTGGGPETATPDEVGEALQLIVQSQTDAARQLADLARSSGAIARTVAAINAKVAGHDALLAGLQRDLAAHSATLGRLRDDLRAGLTAVYREQLVLRDVAEETRDLSRNANRKLDLLLDQAEAAERELLLGYLERIAPECNRLTFFAAESSDTGRAALTLDAIYVRLEVERIGDEARANREDQRRTALRALAERPRLVLLGSPGSGKSTFVNHLARCLALAYLHPTEDWRAHLGDDWPHAALLPIRILLRELAGYVLEQKLRAADAGLIWNLLDAQYGKETAAALQRQARAGNALLLLDGFDEVQVGDDGWPLNVVRDSITMLPDTLGAGSRLLVTCRVLDYGDQPPRRLAGWPDERLAPLSEELRLAFIERYHRALLALNRLDAARAAELEQGLAQSIRTRRELTRLAGNPLLLTMMAQVHTSEGSLPGTRVQLYDLCVRWLMSRWNPRPGERPLGEQLGLREWNESNLYELMELIGHTAHLRGTFPDNESGANLYYSILRDAVSGYFNPAADPARQPESDSRAAIFAGYIGRASNGLLQVHAEPGARQAIYRFPHRTFQEYLAGRALTDGGLRLPDEDANAERDLVTRALRYVDTGAQWREALLLAASHSAQQGRAGDVADLARELLPNDGMPLNEALAQRIIIAGEVLAEVGRDRVARLSPKRAEVWDDAISWLLRLLPYPPEIPVPPLAPPIRARAGVALALLGDPRPGVCALPAGLDDPYWAREIPAGTYPIAGGKARIPLAAFRIARYPVTVWQFRRFVAAGGYEDEQWWTKEGRKWRKNLSLPSRWGDPDWMADNQPIDGISWPVAMAFCAWIIHQTRLPDGWEIGLPSEAEWEVAAMWDADAGNMRTWQPPEGKLWQNVKEAGIGRTSPVGLFPQGMSPCGALDMAGNVWEWSTSDYSDYPAKAHLGRGDFTRDDHGLVIRGGVYWNSDSQSGWDSRGGVNPIGTALGWGFRLLVRSRRNA